MHYVMQLQFLFVVAMKYSSIRW